MLGKRYVALVECIGEWVFLSREAFVMKGKLNEKEQCYEESDR